MGSAGASAARTSAAGARAGGDANVAQYRLIARALRSVELAPLPSDFAARMAARVAVESRAASERVEVWLERGLIALLLVAGGVALTVFNGEWLVDTLSFSVPEGAAPTIQTLVSWSIAIAGCVGISSAFALARKS